MFMNLLILSNVFIIISINLRIKLIDKIDFRFPNINYTNNDSKLLDTFVNYTKDLDKIRDTNVLDHCPELTDLFV